MKTLDSGLLFWAPGVTTLWRFINQFVIIFINILLRVAVNKDE